MLCSSTSGSPSHELGSSAHHAQFCSIHFKRLPCKLNAAYTPTTAAPPGAVARSVIFPPSGWMPGRRGDARQGLGFLCERMEADASMSYPWRCCCYFGCVSHALPFGKVHRQPAGSLVGPPLVSVVAFAILPSPLLATPTAPAPRHLVCPAAVLTSSGGVRKPALLSHVPKAVDVFHSQTCCWMTLNARLGRKEAGMLR